MNYTSGNTCRPAYSSSDTCVSGPQSASAELMEIAHSLAARAQSLADDMHIKLQPVMNESAPASAALGTVQRVYPPLFNSFREQFVRIESALDAIQDALSRTEL